MLEICVYLPALTSVEVDSLILDDGCWVLDVGCRVLGVGCWMLNGGCWMLDVGQP